MSALRLAAVLLGLLALAGCPTGATDPCPGGSGEAICCDADETACGTSADPWGEECCSADEECHSCWDSSGEMQGGLCLAAGEECPYPGPVD